MRCDFPNFYFARFYFCILYLFIYLFTCSLLNSTVIDSLYSIDERFESLVLNCNHMAYMCTSLAVYTMVQGFCHSLQLVPLWVSSSSFINSPMGQHCWVWVTGIVIKYSIKKVLFHVEWIRFRLWLSVLGNYVVPSWTLKLFSILPMVEVDIFRKWKGLD